MRTLLFGVVVKVAVWLYGRFDIRAKWLAHYLLGDGSPLVVPEDVVRASVPLYEAEYIADNAIGRPYRFDSSGTLFWLVGTATPRGGWDEDGGLTIYGEDRYDWHPNRHVCRECGAWGSDVSPRHGCWACGAGPESIRGEWWWSPTAIPGWVAKLIRWIWPDAQPYIDVGHTGKMAISNGLWPLLGGREFTTLFRIHYTAEECREYFEEESYGQVDDDDLVVDLGAWLSEEA